MHFFTDNYDFKTNRDIFSFFNRAILYRNNHKEESGKVARFVFDTTHKSKLGSLYSENIDSIRNEFGALEAPGRPADNSDLNEFIDHLWDRLRLIIEEGKKRSI